MYINPLLHGEFKRLKKRGTKVVKIDAIKRVLLANILSKNGLMHDTSKMAKWLITYVGYIGQV